ncbi:MAG: sugar nucleotide-binding protein [Verrucomicrobia bacterium]|nr:sugar nucleotide-binding protein [Verrucomicrobiota bacterium]MBI3871401.1 sugar nucleotide-binding protein [Verrucomicrobiota bacterium]
MILLLGATGYIGQAFKKELEARGWKHRAISRTEADYSRFTPLMELLRSVRPSFVVNAAGFTGKPNVDACEQQKTETLQGNTLFPQTLSHACAATNTPWGHVSSGCVYSGAKVRENGAARIERDLAQPALMALLARDRSKFEGFTESDAPNFSFRQPPCSFYSGSKALGEEAIAGVGQSFIWRLRIPFDELDNGRNYLSKIQRYAKVYNNVNSLSHRGDFVRACLDLWERRAPFGTYNVTNPGFVTTRQVVERLEKILRTGRAFEYWADDAEFYRVAAQTPRSNCILDTRKLLEAGVKMRPVEEALDEALKRWVPEGKARPAAA